MWIHMMRMHVVFGPGLQPQKSLRGKVGVLSNVVHLEHINLKV